MGWFLRKAFLCRTTPIEPARKRGIGASVGVKGARLGVDATGTPYAAGGRHGLYFRERLGASRPTGARRRGWDRAARARRPIRAAGGGGGCSLSLP